MMIPSSTKLFVFAFATLSISALFRDDRDQHWSKITGVSTLLADSSVSREELFKAFVSVIQPLALKSILAKDYIEALKLIFYHNTFNRQKGMSSVDVSTEIRTIKENLVKGLLGPPDALKKHLEDSVGKVVTLMKREFVFMLNIQKKGPKEFIKITDRVAELKASLNNHISNLRDIADIRREGLIGILNEVIPDIHPDVRALKAAYEDNLDLFTKPYQVLEAALAIQIGQIEDDIVKRKGIAPTPEVVRIAETTFDLLSASFQDFMARGESENRLIKALLKELKTIAQDQSNVFGPETTPKVVKGVRVFLAGFLRFVIQQTSKGYSEFLVRLFPIISNYFEEVLPEFEDPCLDFLKLHSIADETFLLAGLEKGEESPESRRFQKYLNVIIATYNADKMNYRDIKNFIDKLEEYVDISETEVRALRLVTRYFSKNPSIHYWANADILWLGIVELLEFISATDQETLSEDNIFSRFNTHLSDKADKAADSGIKWRYAALQIANFLRSRKDFDLSIPALDESKESFFISPTQYKFFYKAHKMILGLLLKANIERLEALAIVLANPLKQTKPDFRKMITEQIEIDRRELDKKNEVTPEESQMLVSRITKILTFGLHFSAEKKRLI